MERSDCVKYNFPRKQLSDDRLSYFSLRYVVKTTDEVYFRGVCRAQTAVRNCIDSPWSWKREPSNLVPIVGPSRLTNGACRERQVSAE
ncbi:hypothetical protein HPB48_001294 [Haemaphysalis longicornis]|uniref:Uncharacterized protein n=1 Tax=Haemaphysalis longicornis TaxID=44386 RepID=A0A9J6FMR2_HAELO|nr:hypothetical protein HPB48_001294 [Haemaphysalis longicornis]